MNEVLRLPGLAWRRAVNSLALLRHTGQVDAVLASYPKSGRTWFRFILSSYLAERFGLMPAVDLHMMFRVMPNFDMDQTRGIPAFVFGAHRPRPPLVAVSHLPCSRLQFRNPPVIFMLRDPRDVMVSAYFHATRQKHRFRGGMEPFLRDPDQGIAAMVHYLNGWASGLQHRRHLVVTYEGLTRDPQAETARVLGFLNVEVVAGELERAVAAGQFRNMQILEQADGLPGHEYDRSDRESLRMRQGKVRGFADYLRPAEVELIQTTCARELSPAAQELLSRTGWRAG
ncbi:sulfotransferase domain-containing protein (plasmid) [Paracoccus sp. T5]